MDRIALTDDEVVALAVRADQPWPAPLPTVDVASAEQLTAAVARGERSLFVRGLVDDAEVDPALRHLLDATLAGRSVVLVYVGREDLSWVPDGLTYAHYGSRADGSWLTESVTSGGVHHFTRTPSDVARRALGVLVQAVYDEGIAPPSDTGEVSAPPPYLCLVSKRDLSAGESEAVLAVRQAGVSLLTTRDGRVETTSSPVGPVEGLAALMGAAG